MNIERYGVMRMNNKDAIRVLKGAKIYGAFEASEALGMAIDALKLIDDMHNELCAKCGGYRDNFETGQCDRCRWQM